MIATLNDKIPGLVQDSSLIPYKEPSTSVFECRILDADGNVKEIIEPEQVKVKARAMAELDGERFNTRGQEKHPDGTASERLGKKRELSTFTLNCELCEVEFTTYDTRRKYCKEHAGRSAMGAKNQARLIRDRKKRFNGKLFEIVPCIGCKTDFKRSSTKQTYCTEKCRRQAECKRRQEQHRKKVANV